MGISFRRLASLMASSEDSDNKGNNLLYEPWTEKDVESK